MTAQEYYEKGEILHAKGERSKAQEYLQKALQKAREELPDIDSPKALKYLANKAYEFFICEYKDSSNEIHSIIKKYSELLAVSQMEFLNYRDTKNDVIDNVLRPLNSYYDKLEEWIFNTIQSSMIKKFPNKFYYTRKALELFPDDTPDLDEFRNTQCKGLASKLMSEFVIELYYSIKKHYEILLQKDYSVEYHWFSENKDRLDGLWSELYGRSIRVVFDCLISMGLKISLLDAEKIFYNTVNLEIIGNGDLNVTKNWVFNDLNINKNQEKMENNKTKFEDVKVGRDISNDANDTEYKRVEVGRDINNLTKKEEREIELSTPWGENNILRGTDINISRDSEIFIKERTELHKKYIEQQEKTKRISLVLAVVLILFATALLIFAPEGKETLSYIVCGVLFVFAAGAVGYKRIWGKIPFAEFEADNKK